MSVDRSGHEYTANLARYVENLSVSFPTFRDPEREPAIVDMLQHASRVLSKSLGCTGFPLGLVQEARR